MIGVIGGTGGIGRLVVAGLIEQGLRPRAIVRDAARARALLGQALDYALADIGDAGALSGALQGLSALFLVSPVGTDMAPLQRGVIDAAARAGVGHVVRISSIAADAGSPMRFARWHAELDAALEASGLDWTHLRASNFMRNLLGFADGIRRSGELRAPLGDGKLCFVDDGDIAAVAVRSLLEPRHRRRTYVVTGAQWQGYREVADIIGQASGRPLAYRSVSEDEARQAWHRAGHEPWLVDDLVAMYRTLAVATESPVTDHVERVTGRAPRLLRDFVAEHARAFAEPPAAGPR